MSNAVKIKIDNSDLKSWCNCSNFPYQKCDECKFKLSDLTSLKEGETFTLN